MDDPAWTPAYSIFTISMLWGVLAFGLYYFLSVQGRMGRWLRSSKRGPDPSIKKVLLQRISGFLLLGILSLLLIQLVLDRSPSDFGWGIRFQAFPPWWTYLLIPLILITGYLWAPSRANLEQYPQFRISVWTPALLVLSGISWILFIAGYEFLFRGLLLNAALEVMVPWAAIVLNCILYSAAHLYKGIHETAGAVPVGILFCYLTLVTGNIWTVVMLHSFMALSNEWLTIWRNPEIAFKR